jgi:hypothetical protein
VAGRELTQNIVDLDTAARCFGTASQKDKLPILAFWDGIAAFPSVAHAWLWTVLKCSGFPLGFINLIRGIYCMNGSWAVGSDGFEFLFWIWAGVLQGCPLSGLLFVVILDPLLNAIYGLLDRKGRAVTRACADDLGAAVADIRSLQVFENLFKIMQKVANLHLSPTKCILVPIAVKFSPHVKNMVKEWLERHLPSWYQFRVEAMGKYLGLMMGPAVTMHSWKGPLDKYAQRVQLIASARLAPSVGTFLYNSRAIPVLGYVGRLVPAPPNLLQMEMDAANKVLHLPGKTISAAAAHHLDRLGMVAFRSASALCASALIGTATAGKIR